ncbi:MAG: ATP-binding cassette domain-containing protein [Acidobacteriota bacterium]
MNNLTVECRGLCKEFNQHRALKNLDLEVEKGIVFGLLGPNGSGKTTTIRIALGILNPDAGEVKVFGQGNPLSHRRRIGYLPEERGLYPRMKVREQLAFLGAIRGLEYREADKRACSWLEKMGLADRAQARTNELSKGMQQKIQFASAVMHEPELIVLDEPFTGLDPINSRLLKGLLLEQKEKGVTIVLSTHRMEEVEAMCDSISLVHKGERVLHGRLSDIKASYGRNSVSIEYGGKPDCLEDLPGVLSVNDSGRSARFRLEKGADTQELLRELLNRTSIGSFVVDEPHLEEIYLEKVGHSFIQTDSSGDFQPGEMS